MTTTEQTGRSLPTNYHHAWEMDGPNDVVSPQLKPSTSSPWQPWPKATPTPQLGRSMPAIGAYTSASRILETAADCVSQLQNMDLEPEPELLYTSQNRPNTLIARANALAQSLADANQNLMASLNQYKNAASVNPQQFYEQSGWYAMAQHRVLRSEWTAKAAEALEELRATGPAADPREIQRRTRLIYQVAIWPTDNDYKGVDYAVLQEPDPSLGAQARQADRNRNDRLAQILEPLQRRRTRQTLPGHRHVPRHPGPYRVHARAAHRHHRRHRRRHPAPHHPCTTAGRRDPHPHPRPRRRRRPTHVLDGLHPPRSTLLQGSVRTLPQQLPGQPGPDPHLPTGHHPQRHRRERPPTTPGSTSSSSPPWPPRVPPSKASTPSHATKWSH